MIKQFFRQAWTMMKQQKLFTGIYIAGTAASIAMAMTIFVILYIKLGPLYPEENRDRMLIFTEVVVADDEGSGSIFNPRLKYIEQLKQESKLLKKVGVRETVPFVSDFSHLCEISSDNSNTTINELPAYVDCGYWQLFNFRFVRIIFTISAIYQFIFYKNKENPPIIAHLSLSLHNQLKLRNYHLQ